MKWKLIAWRAGNAGARGISGSGNCRSSTRRARLLAITADGQRTRLAVQAEIQANEERVLALLRPGDREAFLRVADALSRLPAAEIAGA